MQLRCVRAVTFCRQKNVIIQQKTLSANAISGALFHNLSGAVTAFGAVHSGGRLHAWRHSTFSLDLCDKAADPNRVRPPFPFHHEDQSHHSGHLFSSGGTCFRKNPGKTWATRARIATIRHPVGFCMTLCHVKVIDVVLTPIRIRVWQVL